MTEHPRDLAQWEASDHIEDLKSAMNVEGACVGHQAVVRSAIFTVRVVGDLRRGLRDTLNEIRAENHALGPQNAALRNLTKPGGLVALLLSIGLPAPICLLLWFIGRARGWW